MIAPFIRLPMMNTRHGVCGHQAVSPTKENESFVRKRTKRCLASVVHHWVSNFSSGRIIHPIPESNKKDGRKGARSTKSNFRPRAVMGCINQQLGVKMMKDWERCIEGGRDGIRSDVGRT